MVYSVYAPIMVDMKYILHTSMKWISLFATFETTGFILGTFIVMVKYKCISRQLLLALFFTALTIASAVIPLSPYLWVLYICAFVIGIGSSVYAVFSTVWMIELWRDSRVPIIQMYEVCFGIGSVISTAAMKPYLIGETSAQNQTTYSDTELIIDVNDVIDRRSRLMIPTLIIGGCIITVPLALFIMHFIKPYKEPKVKNEDNSEDTTEDEKDNQNIKINVKLFDRKETPRKTTRLLFALFFTFYIIFETIFLKFSQTYFQYSPLRLTAQKATEIYTVAITVYTVGLVLNIFYPIKFKIRTILASHYVIIIIGAILLIPARTSVTTLWAASVTMCLGFSGMFAGIYAFTEQHMNFTTKLNSVFVLFRGVFTLITPFIVGNWIEDYSLVFIYMEFLFLAISIALFLTILVIIRKYSYLTQTNVVN
ncbi:unnamed protein product, partial [Medioppia subpectinata]